MFTHQKASLLIIDPQNDFCDIPFPVSNKNKPALPVKGAFDDMSRLSQVVSLVNFQNIFVTMDTHANYDIAHPSWWTNEKGDAPSPFTLISFEDVQNRVWFPVDHKNFSHALDYTLSLKKNQRYDLIIWPEHCINNTWGHEVVDVLMSSLLLWENKSNKKVDYINKGMNPNTEHYSALKAEFQIKEDSHTLLNIDLLNKLVANEQLIIAGEALSHCVASTVSDLLDNIESSYYHNIYFLTDCSSPVEGFEENGKIFVEKIKSLGINLIECRDLICVKNN